MAKPAFNSALYSLSHSKLKVDASDYSFRYESKDGTKFSSETLTLSKVVIKNAPSDQKELLLAYGEMMCYFMLNVYPHLNGFPGYDCITITSISKK